MHAWGWAFIVCCFPLSCLPLQAGSPLWAGEVGSLLLTVSLQLAKGDERMQYRDVYASGCLQAFQVLQGQTATELPQQFQRREIESRRRGQVCNNSMSRKTLSQPYQAASITCVKKDQVYKSTEMEHGVETIAPLATDSVTRDLQIMTCSLLPLLYLSYYTFVLILCKAREVT